MADDFKRAEQKQIAVLRAQFRLKQPLEASDYEHDVVIPAREQIKTQAAQGLVTETTLVEIENGEDPAVA